ncbi:TauD/TfdA family dioxygenase [Cupriavidus sp. P-10]|uniref:TauD/TfdA family dioxygenase n=1 Tax=unclassified Cupriavidus TaxID=2640874 RepID=UPI000E2FA977|nr:TauD/TfdA family dioxygenase [Cupriavidus sp. P-10]BDB23323.1 TauD/TfdA family dioxygenase [Cupriavidus sp. P-10]
MEAAQTAAALKAVETPAAWEASDIAAREGEWVVWLGADEIAQLDAALAHTKSLGLAVPAICKETFPLGSLAAKLEVLRHRLERGLGVVLLRGLPVERYSKMDAGTIYWGIGMHLGRAVAQNAFGDVLGHVWDLGKDPKEDMTARGYQSRHRLPFHTDGADVVGLLCLRTARRGGMSSIASSMGIHNAMLREHPELLARLYQPFAFDRRHEEAPGQAPYTMTHVFSWHNGRLFNRYIRSFINTAQRFPDAPRLAPEDIAALDQFDAYTQDPRFRIDMALAPGDMQFLNNYVVLHSRTSYEDHPELDRKRHLLRLWLFTPGLADVPESFRLRYLLTDAWAKNPRPPIYDVNQIMGVTTH